MKLSGTDHAQNTITKLDTLLQVYRTALSLKVESLVKLTLEELQEFFSGSAQVNLHNDLIATEPLPIEVVGSFVLSLLNVFEHGTKI